MSQQAILDTLQLEIHQAALHSRRLILAPGNYGLDYLHGTLPRLEKIPVVKCSNFIGDTLDMAANAPTTDENYKKGVVMTLDKAAKALDALHVEEIEALGKPFDPNFMNAVQQIPAPDGQESGTVVTVFQKGYKLGDKIIRHATVVVAE